MKRHFLKLLLATAALMITFGCGGGPPGGGSPTATVGGRILLVGTGQPPLPSATVSIAGRSMVTNTLGEFDFTGIPVTPSPQITVTGQGIKTLTQTVPALEAGRDNDLGDIWVVDENGSYTANVRGTVVNAENFQPVANAVVTISGQRAITATNGTFQLLNLPVGLGGTGVVVGTIKATGFEPKDINIDPPLGPSPPDNDLGPIAVSPPVGTIPGGPFNIRGTVSQAGVSDMSFTTVDLIRKSDSQVVATMTTGADGRYGFWVVGGEYTVRAQRGQLVQSADATLVRIDQPITVNVTLTP